MHWVKHFKISQNGEAHVALTGLCHQVHAAGSLPNNMNRFLLSNMQKVLFVN
jgi:hypothetical protein